MPRPRFRSSSCGAKLSTTVGNVSSIYLHAKRNPRMPHNISASTAVSVVGEDASGNIYRWEGTCQAAKNADPPSKNTDIVELELTFRGVTVKTPTSSVGDCIVVDITLSNGSGASDETTEEEVIFLDT